MGQVLREQTWKLSFQREVEVSPGQGMGVGSWMGTVLGKGNQVQKWACTYWVQGTKGDSSGWRKGRGSRQHETGLQRQAGKA